MEYQKQQIEGSITGGNKETWKALLKRLKLQYLHREHNDFFHQSGGYRMQINPYSDNTPSGLSRAITDFLKFVGGYTTRNKSIGSKCITALFNGNSINIEVSVGANRLSPPQYREWAKVESAGGLYFVARDFPSFLEWWMGHFPLSISSIKPNL